MSGKDDTLVDRHLRRLKNNPLIATIVVAAIAVSSVLAFWNSLPVEWQDKLWPAAQATPQRPDNGWLFAGYLDAGSARLWASAPRAKVVRKSGAPDRPYPIRKGDVVTPTSARPQVIVGFRTSGTENVLTPPPQLVEVISAERDYTGRMLKPGELFEVADVEVSSVPGSDWSVWLRLVPYAGEEN
jgi:hypothetical protein